MSFVNSLMNLHWKRMTKVDQARIDAQTPPAGITEVRDIPYLNSGKKEHLLDIYFPEQTDAFLPVILNIHGGGFNYGTKALNRHYGMYLASQGFTVVNIDYRLVPEVTIREQIQDLLAAFRWIDKHGKEYHCDLQHVFATGDSAGGYLCAYAVAVNQFQPLQNLLQADGASFHIEAIGMICSVFFLKSGISRMLLKTVWGKDIRKQPYYDFADISELVELCGLPPVYLITSEEDFMLSHSIKMEALLKEKQIPFEMRNLEKGTKRKLTHVFSVLNPEWEESIQLNNEMLAFFHSFLKQSNAEETPVKERSASF